MKDLIIVCSGFFRVQKVLAFLMQKKNPGASLKNNLSNQNNLAFLQLWPYQN
jgi:hypothetical protein